MAVNVHDFPDPEVGKAIPYGLYDLAQNSGWVSVGTDHDTASFAVATIRRWWYGEGSSIYSDADRLFDLRRRWGQQWYRLRLWKKELAELGISFTQVPRDLVAGLPFVKPTGPTSWGP